MTYVQAGDGYSTGTLGELGLEPDRVDELIERARRDVGEGQLPSCQLALARHGKIGALVTLGDAEPDSRYVMFSCSKAVTGAVVWLLLGEGVLSQDQKVTEFIPEFGTHGKDVVTIEQLLTHTSGFPHAPMNPTVWHDRDARVQTFAHWRLNWEPGSRFEYHPSSAHWVLAEIVDRVTGDDYRTIVKTRIAEPLGIRLRLGLPQEEAGDVNKLVPFNERPSPAQLAELGMSGWNPGEVVAENLVQLTDPDVLEVGIPSGGAVATAADLALFYQALIHGDPPLWDPEVLRLATAEVIFDLPEQLLGVPANRTLGITLAGDDGQSHLRGFGYTVSGRTFGHGGAGGQIAWGDPETGLSFAYLTNGFDSYIPNVWRRIAGLSSKAGACVS